MSIFSWLIQVTCSLQKLKNTFLPTNILINLATKFNWTAILADQNVPIKAAQVTLHLPAKLSKFTKNFTTGEVTGTTKIIDPVTIQFVAKGSIQPKAGLVVFGQFPTNSLIPEEFRWSWWPIVLIYLIIFFLITSSGKAGCIVTTILFAIVCLLAGQYGGVLGCILLIIWIIYADDGGGNYNSDDYNDVDWSS